MTLAYLIPLSPEEQLAQGLAAPQPMALADQVRFSEIDMLHHVNNKAYFDWFEATRVQYSTHLANRHFDSNDLPRVVIRNASVRYVKEILPGESYVTTARVKTFRNTSYLMEQQVWAGGELRATLDVVLVLRTQDGAAGYPIPDSLKKQFMELDGATPEG